MDDWRHEVHDPENCPGCRPAAIDMATGQVDARLTALAQQAWGKTSRRQRKAWHRVTCLNSRDPYEVELAQRVARLIQAEFDAATTRTQ